MRFRLLPLAAALAVAAACSEGTVTLAGNQGVSVSTRSGRTASAPAGAAASVLDDTLTAGNDTLIITSAEVVLREIEIDRGDDGGCNDGGDACEEIEFGPILLDLPLEPGAERFVTVELPAGTYTEVEFEVHKPDDDDPADIDFLQQHPDFADISIRVQGVFIQGATSTPFVYETDLNVDQELELSPPLVITAETATNVTIFVNLDVWFRGAGGALVDPASANDGGPNENLVRDNIIDSFRAFEDRDEDGDDED
jgi:hypothetical protein